MVKPRPAALALALSSLLLALAVPSRSATSEWAVHPQVRARLLTARAVAAPGETLLAGVEFALEPGWHAYWKNSGDAGFAPRVSLAGSADVVGTELQWPAPRRFQVTGGLQAFGYEHEVVYPLRVELAAGARDHTVLRGALDYVVCAEECVPYRDTLELAQPLGAAPSDDPATRPALVAAVSSVPTPVTDAHLVATATLTRPEPGKGDLELVLRGARPAAGGADLFLESSDLFDAAVPQVDTLPDALRFRVRLAWKRADVAPPVDLAVAWTATGLASPAPSAVSGHSRVAGGTGGGPLSWLFVLPFLAIALVFLWLLRATRAHRTATPER